MEKKRQNGVVFVFLLGKVLCTHDDILVAVDLISFVVLIVKEKGVYLHLKVIYSCSITTASPNRKF